MRNQPSGPFSFKKRGMYVQSQGYSCLRSGLMLRGHPVAYRHAGILPAGLLLLLQVLIVGHLLLLLVGHIARVHAGRPGHIGLLGIDIAMAHILGGFGGDVGSINPILVGGGIGGIETSLWAMGSVDWSAKATRARAGRMPATHLNQVLALSLGHQWLQLGRREGIYEASLRHDQQKNLGTSEHRQLVGLIRDRIESLVSHRA